MNWDKIACNKCGLINDYNVIIKSNQQTCYCNGCNNFLGNKPKDSYDLNTIRFPFGKYSGEIINLHNDMNYLRWFYNNCKPKGSIKQALEFKLNIK